MVICCPSSFIAGSDKWSVQEKKLFNKGIAIYKKDFFLVQKLVSSLSFTKHIAKELICGTDVGVIGLFTIMFFSLQLNAPVCLYYVTNQKCQSSQYDFIGDVLSYIQIISPLRPVVYAVMYEVGVRGLFCPCLSHSKVISCNTSCVCLCIIFYIKMMSVKKPHVNQY